jgi:hypothetical protein
MVTWHMGKFNLEGKLESEHNQNWIENFSSMLDSRENVVAYLTNGLLRVCLVDCFSSRIEQKNTIMEESFFHLIPTFSYGVW